ncbi:aminotransferase class V-fold PLP-dependent enzyme [Stenotrophomonas sp. MH181796]|uniref:aminotransferase class V-fold PLP-dependent enzyme n=1 Tax=Stenotrophomonas sp. MH181796 TaxID=2339228 RepID=UPI00129D204A|nr:aminotransferase class V-fold PLP-dependent enzyme [Stenotrophomonas sp. MH181796]MRI42173.1 aminotransferase class V-fold PLP-dependent enzyme [Stenotrophomonas sp. MH181796]
MTTASLLDPAAFDMPRDVLWLSHCKDGPLPRASADAVQALMGVQLRPWELRWEEDFLDVQRRLRHAAATLLAVDAADISLMTCTSSGLEAVAFGYPWQAGDEILIPAGEFPSNRLPWLALSRRGVRCREVDLWQPGQRPTARDAPEDRLIEAITPRTRMIAASWVRFQDGIKLDLQKLGAACRGAGVDLVVDAIQGAGTTTLELTGVSALATGGHKGLLGLQGQGFLWTEPGFRQKLVPLGTWLSGPEEFSQTSDPAPAADLWATDGRRLEAGSPSILSCEALASSLQLLLDCGGVAAIQAHVASLQRQLLDQLAQGDGTWRAEAARLMALLEQDRLGPTLCFALPEDRLARLLATAEAQGIHSSVRLGYLRVAFHCWHDAEDVRRCVAWLLGTLD